MWGEIKLTKNRIKMTDKETFKNFHQVAGILYREDNPVTRKGKKGDFTSKEFILELRNSFEGRTLTDFITFELREKHFDVLSPYEAGDAIVVNFRLSGRLWKDKEGKEKAISSLVAYKVSQLPIEVAEEMGLNKQIEMDVAVSAPKGSDNPFVSDTSSVDDLPF